MCEFKLRESSTAHSASAWWTAGSRRRSIALRVGADGVIVIVSHSCWSLPKSPPGFFPLPYFTRHIRENRILESYFLETSDRASVGSDDSTTIA